MEKEYLVHHGIKGQKWGVRRFQNEDGSLTDAGKARYNDDLTKKDVNKMSTKDLESANNRLQKEQTYRQLTGTTQPGKAINRDTAIKIGATFVATGAATFLLRKYRTGTWLGGQRVKNGTFGTGAAGIARKRRAIGSAVTTALVAGGIGSLMVGATSLGGTARPESKKED